MPIKFSQFTNRTSDTAGTTIVGFDGNQNIKILSSDLLSGFINGTPHTLPVFATANTLGDSIVSQNSSATQLFVTGITGINSTDFTTLYGVVPDLRVGSVSGNGNPGVIDILRKDGNITAGETSGVLQFSVDDDNNYAVAQIEVESDATAQSGNSGGGILKFKTTDSQSGATPTEHMRITNDGNVGIGTTNPDRLLVLNHASDARIKLQVNGTDTAQIQTISNQARYHALGSSTSLQLWTNGGERMHIDSSGNVGIGTSSPTAKTDIRTSASSGATNAPTFRAFGYDTDSYFEVNNNANNSANIKLTRSDAATMFSIDGHSGTAFFEGNVGIGTNNPSVRLDINAGDGIKVQDTGDVVFLANPTTGTFSLGDTGGVGGTAYIIGDSTNIDFFGDGDVRFQNEGNVGIGTTSPTAPLEVNGNLVFTSENNSITFGGVTSSPSLQITNSSSESRFNRAGGSGVLKFDSYSGIEITTGGYDNVINSSGNWGIGTTNPSQKLDVIGSIEVNGGIYVGGTGSANYLDDYEEGSFTPSYTGSSGMAVTHDIQIGRYVKIGRLVHFSISLGTDSVGYCSGNLEITGLPFTATDLDGAATPGLNYAFDVSLANYRFTVAQNTSRIRIYNSNSTSQFATCSTASGTNSNRLKLVGTYITTT